jgi:lipopolysaccharide transport system permease protein
MLEADSACTTDTTLATTAPIVARPRIAPSKNSTKAAAATPSVTYIYPARGWQLINFQELWQFHELIFFLVWRDVKVRYKQTALGAAWAILQPLVMMVVFTIFFGRMAGVSSGDTPYPLFVYPALLPWTFFAAAIAGAGNSVVGSERLITKIYFPRLALPFAAVGAAVVDFMIAFCLLIPMMLCYRIVPGPAILLAPVVFGLIMLAGLGIGTLLAAFNVAYRDFRHLIPFLIQIWMFATPTIYMQPKNTEGGWVQLFLMLNPMTSLIATFRASTVGGPIPWISLSYAAGVVVLIFGASCLYFRTVEDGFADVI